MHIEDFTDLTFRVQEYKNLPDQALAVAEERQKAQQAADEVANHIKDEFLAGRFVRQENLKKLKPLTINIYSQNESEEQTCLYESAMRSRILIT